jgi:uncharacterized protein YybS (DUF2232 family)
MPIASSGIETTKARLPAQCLKQKRLSSFPFTATVASITYSFMMWQYMYFALGVYCWFLLFVGVASLNKAIVFIFGSVKDVLYYEDYIGSVIN